MTPEQIFPAKGKAIPIHFVAPKDLEKQREGLSVVQRTWLASQGFAARPGSFVVVPGASGRPDCVLAGKPADGADPFSPGRLASLLPAGHYAFAGGLEKPDLAALGWLLEAYQYDPFRPVPLPQTSLACPRGVDRNRLLTLARAVYAARDLVNTPANLLGPVELEKAARQLAVRHRAAFRTVTGRKLELDFPLVHHVGKASSRAPRLVDFTWGPARAPKVTLVGKGVCFDTGGLDIKPSSSMLLMKKDMGGAANVLGLAQLVMEAKLPVRLRVIIPAVENAIAGEAFRPGDVFRTRKGLTVEIGNTDAEGRLILCEALALADEEKPDLLIDMATLTGAARVALGPDLPPFYTDDEVLAADLGRHAMAENDPLWRLPLWRPYDALYDSPVADMNNAGSSGFAGSITAALFLRRFVEKARTYVHLDIFAWTPIAKPGRPKGAEAQGMRALFALISERYGK